MGTKEIVFISNFFGDGGAARVLSVLTGEFVKQGYKITLCSYSQSDKDEYKNADGVEHIKFNLRRKNKIAKRIERISVLRKELKKHKAATVVAFEYFVNMQTIVACFGLKNKIIISERNDTASMGGKFPTSLLRNILYRFCDCLVCQTPDAKAYFPKAIQKKSVIIPNPIKEGLPSAFSGEREKKIINFCRLEKQKNLPLLIDAFELFLKKQDEYALHIYGDGREKTNLEEYIISKGMERRVFLHKATFDVHEKVLKAAMFVSSSDYEGLSNSMLEAMGIGLPVVCTDCPCGGARMVINDHENGILVRTGDAKALSEAMLEIVNDDVLSWKLSENAVKIKEELSVQKILCEWEKLI